MGWRAEGWRAEGWRAEGWRAEAWRVVGLGRARLTAATPTIVAPAAVGSQPQHRLLPLRARRVLIAKFGLPLRLCTRARARALRQRLRYPRHSRARSLFTLAAALRFSSLRQRSGGHAVARTSTHATALHTCCACRMKYCFCRSAKLSQR
eukprot:3250539-Prymnesium_polylepis.1